MAAPGRSDPATQPQNWIYSSEVSADLIATIGDSSDTGGQFRGLARSKRQLMPELRVFARSLVPVKDSRWPGHSRSG